MHLHRIITLFLLLFALSAASSAAYAAPKAGLDILPPNAAIVTENGDSQEFAIALASAPHSKVILNIAVSDESEGRVDKTRLEFLRENWNEPQIVTVTGVDDRDADGNIKFDINISVDYTKDTNYKSITPQTLSFINIDNDLSENKNAVSSVAANLLNAQKTRTTAVRIVAANTTTGDDQSYDNGEGIRIFKALRPDIVLIQEFNYRKNSIKSFVASTFGSEYQYYRGPGDIPNGIISKFPIIESGSWKSNKVKNRQWDWAVIDVPGKRDLLVVSVHLYTQANEEEMEPLRKQIEKKIAADKKDYYVMLGGDFNQESWEPIRRHFSTMFVIGSEYKDWPADQDGFVKTNVTRHKQIDYLLCNPDLCALETPAVVGRHAYAHGHVLDSRVYKKHGELDDIKPVRADDSDALNMQHMAVVRDFVFSE